MERMDGDARVAERCGARQLAILGYHKIGKAPDDWETWYYIPEATFAGHLEYLSDHGWSFIDVDRFLGGLSDPQSLPARSALLTFDDGYRNLLQCGAPVLERFRAPAVLFMPTDLIGGRNVFDADCEPEEMLCDWNDLRALEARGVSVESHAASHRAFSDMSLRERVEEVQRSKAVLERGLHKTVRLLSYPYGDAGDAPEALAGVLTKAGYRAACLYGGGPLTWPMSSPFLLSRIAMGPDTDIDGVLGQVQASK